MASATRWAAAQRVFELFPECAENLDQCMNLNNGTVRRRAINQGWLISQDVIDADDADHRRRNLNKDKNHLSTPFADIVGRYLVMLRKDIAALEYCEEEVPSDARLRTLSAIAKTLLITEDLQQRVEKVANVRKVEDDDLLEIHGRLARKIEAIVQQRHDP